MQQFPHNFIHSIPASPWILSLRPPRISLFFPYPCPTSKRRQVRLITWHSSTNLAYGRVGTRSLWPNNYYGPAGTHTRSHAHIPRVTLEQTDRTHIWGPVWLTGFAACAGGPTMINTKQFPIHHMGGCVKMSCDFHGYAATNCWAIKKIRSATLSRIIKSPLPTAFDRPASKQ